MLLHARINCDIFNVAHIFSESLDWVIPTRSRLFYAKRAPAVRDSQMLFLVLLSSIFYFRDYSGEIFIFRSEIFTLFFSGCAVFVYVRFKGIFCFSPEGQ